jgi:hypothetical protein
LLHELSGSAENGGILKLRLLEGSFAVCRLPAAEPIPHWIDQTHFWSVTRTRDELSLVCREETVPGNIRVEKGWKIIQVVGPLDFNLTGILASLANPLAMAEVSIFALSTFDTDYLMVRADKLSVARAALVSEGFQFVGE